MTCCPPINSSGNSPCDQAMIIDSCGEAGLPASFDKMSVEGLTQYPDFSPSERSHLESYPAAAGVSPGSHPMSTKSTSSFLGSILDSSDRAWLWQPTAQWGDSHHATSPPRLARQPHGVHESNSSSSSSSSGCQESAGGGSGDGRPTNCSPLVAAPVAHGVGAAGEGLLPPASFPTYSYNLQQPSVGFYRRGVAPAAPGGCNDSDLLQQCAHREQTQHVAKSITKRLSQATHYQQVRYPHPRPSPPLSTCERKPHETGEL